MGRESDRSARAAAWLPALAAAACGSPPDDLRDGVLVLPPSLREASAVVAADATTVACVQDEVGALYFVDLTGAHDVRKVPFGPKGDYEGLARAGDAWWVLRSDGLLLRLRPSRGGGFEVASTLQLPAGHGNWEGLCFDPVSGCLLAMPKDKPEGDKSERDQRPVFAVDPATGALRPEPLLTLSVRELAAEAEARGFPLPTRTTPKGRERIAFKLLASEILVAPASGALYVLSAIDRTLVAVDRTGKLLSVHLLAAEEHPQPEGMAWLPDGRLLVANEGACGLATLRVVELR
jgi:hypothetical protein